VTRQASYTATEQRRDIERIIRFKDLPYNPFRRRLYTVDELMKGYKADVPGTSLDENIAKHFNKDHTRKIPSVHEALAQRIHDHAIDHALYRFALPRRGEPRRIVGVMGGHSVKRDKPLFLNVARLTWQLARKGFSIVSGGGPGVMEAANLGCYLALYGADAVDAAVAILAKSADTSNRKTYNAAAFEVRKRYPNDSGESLAIPTWVYSDEQTGQFSSAIGKYFSNSIREDGLLAIATDGVIFAHGSEGTLQEVFQDAVHNRYWSFNTRAAMVFLDDDGSYSAKPSVFDVVRDRASRPGGEVYTPYDEFVGICKTPEEIVAFIEAHPMVHKPQAGAKRTFGLSNLVLE
jgi:SLOG cluster4 family